MSDQKDTEIVLGTGKLLGVFFALVIMCGTFFGLGYALGRSSTPMTLQNGEATTVTSASGAKPVAGVTVTTAPTATVDPAQDPAVDPNAPAVTQAEQAPRVDEGAPAEESTSTSAVPAPTVKPAATQVVKNPATPELTTAPSSITVQVAAVTKQEDAQALVAALRKKNYPVFVSPNPSTDSLYHVQVGPFAELKDAEAMKSKLAGDGYNAIVKK
jgi:cell division septation protein DedD